MSLPRDQSRLIQYFTVELNLASKPPQTVTVGLYFISVNLAVDDSYIDTDFTAADS